MKFKKIFVGILSFALVFVFLFGCIDKGNQVREDNETWVSPKLEVYSELIKAFEKVNMKLYERNKITKISRFNNYSELVKAFEKSRNSQNVFGGMEMVMDVGMPMVNKSMFTPTEVGGINSTPDFSKTNIQVQGVDEADIVKTDGEYIYNFAKNKLIITKVTPFNESEIVLQMDLLSKGINPREMFILNDKLLLFGSKNEYYYAAMERMYPRSQANSTIQLYDISNKKKPVLEKKVEFEGNYLTSRLIGNNAYFVINSYPIYWLNEKESDNIIPLMTEDGVEKRIANPTEIGFIPPMPVESFVTIASINLNSKKLEKEVIVGNSQNVFASSKNLYLASTYWDYLEPIPFENPKLRKVRRAFSNAEEKTVINKFSLNNGKIDFVNKGEVPGHILNQFSMDEFNGNFRIATTKGNVSRSQDDSTNNLYILSGGMKVIGELTNLASGEKIYSVRFMSEKVYMVTFRKVDPLFVIDASDPEDPKLLGKLKIPGYSDYLHPIDDTHLIGIGKDTIELKEGNFAWYQGIKMAIFDVSDVSNPIEMHKIIIGDRGTQSNALNDHKAFLFDKEKELLVMPITLAEIPKENKKPMEEEVFFPEYGEYTFQGAFVFNVNLENGFSERGRITHVSKEEELKRGYHFGQEYTVTRSLYIDNVLYTLSDKMLKANSLDSLEELKEFVFD